MAKAMRPARVNDRRWFRVNRGIVYRSVRWVEWVQMFWVDMKNETHAVRRGFREGL